MGRGNLSKLAARFKRALSAATANAVGRTVG